jgi:hypothetical protein
MEFDKKSKEIVEFCKIVRKELGNVCFDNIIDQLNTHKYFLGQKLGRNPSLSETVESYKSDVFLPVCHLIKNWEFDIAFKKEQRECLYFSFLEHLYLQRKEQPSLNIETVAHDFCLNYGDNKRGRMLVNLLLKCKAC